MTSADIPPERRRFAERLLEQDGAAMRAAPTEPWSSGQADRQVDRLTPLKRQSYGQAGFDPLRRRVPLAA